MNKTHIHIICIQILDKQMSRRLERQMLDDLVALRIPQKWVQLVEMTMAGSRAIVRDGSQITPVFLLQLA